MYIIIPMINVLGYSQIKRNNNSSFVADRVTDSIPILIRNRLTLYTHNYPQLTYNGMSLQCVNV